MISERLKMVSKYALPGDSVIDVGCDHGYLGLLALNNGASYVELSDNKEGPLSKAKENLTQSKFDETKYAFNLSDGLKNTLKKVYDKCFILGMGADLIIDILKNSTTNIDTFILGANNHLSRLRAFLFENGYQIIDEMIVFDADKYYEFIVCKKVIDYLTYDETDLMFGPILKKEQSVEFKNKWTSILNKDLEIINHTTTQIKNLEHEVKLIKEILCIK